MIPCCFTTSSDSAFVIVLIVRSRLAEVTYFTFNCFFFLLLLHLWLKYAIFKCFEMLYYFWKSSCNPPLTTTPSFGNHWAIEGSNAQHQCYVTRLRWSTLKLNHSDFFMQVPGRGISQNKTINCRNFSRSSASSLGSQEPFSTLKRRKRGLNLERQPRFLVPAQSWHTVNRSRNSRRTLRGIISITCSGVISLPPLLYFSLCVHSLHLFKHYITVDSKQQRTTHHYVVVSLFVKLHLKQSCCFSRLRVPVILSVAQMWWK